MIQLTARKPKAGLDVFLLQSRHFFQNLGLGQPGGQEVQNVGHPNTHATDARPASTLLRVDRNAVHDLSHIHLPRLRA